MRLLIKKSPRFFTTWIILTTFLIAYMEYFDYFYNTYTWNKLKCKNNKDCVRLLLVADPQIIGEQQELWWYLTPLTIRDSDFYLKKTFYWAYKFADPDVIIFLGDLMDEGSIATRQEFYGYIRRIFNIFTDRTTSTIKHIWLPGDNDVGGEGADKITDEKLKRFLYSFSQPELIAHKNITFFKINRLTNTIPVYKGKRNFYDTSSIFVGLSHLPMLFRPSIFVDKVIKKMQPQVFFTAHEHKSMIIRMDHYLKQNLQVTPVMPEDNKIYEYNLGHNDIYEFMVPTCSYRMGTTKIGYGFAIIEKDEIRFTVLWSPSRFLQLAFYLGYIFLTVFIFILYKCRRKRI